MLTSLSTVPDPCPMSSDWRGCRGEYQSRLLDSNMGGRWICENLRLNFMQREADVIGSISFVGEVSKFVSCCFLAIETGLCISLLIVTGLFF
jgi:hypothetical protein